MPQYEECILLGPHFGYEAGYSKSRGSLITLFVTKCMNFHYNELERKIQYLFVQHSFNSFFLFYIMWCNAIS